MTREDAAKLLKSLVSSACAVQRGAMKRRSTTTSTLLCCRAASKLFAALTGEQPTSEELQGILEEVGMV